VEGSIINNPMFRSLLPEVSLLVLLGIVFLSDLLWFRERKRAIGWLTAGGLALIAVILLAIGQPTDVSEPVWGGMLRFDWLSFVFAILFLAGGAATALFAMDIPELQRGEFFFLLLTSILGMTLMAASANLIMLFLAIETTSIPLYILAGFFRDDDKSTESGFKYLLFGAMASAVMVYGFSLLYGFTGTVDIYEIARQLVAGGYNEIVIVASLLLVLVGIGFKISAVPFHFWAPDVYEGAPTPVAGFLSTASKAAGFAVLIRVLLVAFPTTIAPSWVAIVAAISTATMILGNTLALAQKNIKRLLAYSSIAHAGYILIGIAAYSALGIASSVFYIFVYLVTNLAAFGIVATFWRVVGSDEISAYAGLSRRAPGLALAMLVAFLSLAGMPPLGGFVAKFWVFAAAVKSDLIWLAVIGVLNAIIGLYYYLVVLKVVYLYRSEEDDQPIRVTRPYAIALVALTVGIILLGTLIAPWFHWSELAASALFG
jgi:NADH-quinone oxidoreductase subunit N